MNFSQMPKMPGNAGKLAGAGLGGAALLVGSTYFAGSCFYNVDAGHRAIKFNRLTGVGKAVFKEGFHFKMPWFEREIIFDVRTRPHQIVSLTGSRDLQMVNIKLRTLLAPDERNLSSIYTEIGKDYEEKVLPSIVNEILKSVVAQFNASELITQREAVSRRIEEALIKRASDFHIRLQDVSIVHLSFSPEYEKAVESKQVAQQQSERAKYRVKQAVETKKNIILKAEAEAKAAQMIGQAIQDNPGFVELRRIEAAKEVAGMLSKSTNRIVLDSSALLLNVQERADEGAPAMA